MYRKQDEDCNERPRTWSITSNTFHRMLSAVIGVGYRGSEAVDAALSGGQTKSPRRETKMTLRIMGSSRGSTNYQNPSHSPWNSPTVLRLINISSTTGRHAPRKQPFTFRRDIQSSNILLAFRLHKELHYNGL
jgi:hypothetical protein